jgi:hypothetical protein
VIASVLTQQKTHFIAVLLSLFDVAIDADLTQNTVPCVLSLVTLRDVTNFSTTSLFIVPQILMKPFRLAAKLDASPTGLTPATAL